MNATAQFTCKNKQQNKLPTNNRLIDSIRKYIENNNNNNKVINDNYLLVFVRKHSGYLQNSGSSCFQSDWDELVGGMYAYPHCPGLVPLL